MARVIDLVLLLVAQPAARNPTCWILALEEAILIDWWVFNRVPVERAPGETLNPRQSQHRFLLYTIESHLEFFCRGIYLFTALRSVHRTRLWIYTGARIGRGLFAPRHCASHTNPAFTVHHAIVSKFVKAASAVHHVLSLRLLPSRFLRGLGGLLSTSYDDSLDKLGHPPSAWL